MNWKLVADFISAIVGIASLLKVYQEYQIQKNASSMNTDIIFVEINRKPLDIKFRKSVVLFYLFTLMSFPLPLILQFPILSRLLNQSLFHEKHGIEVILLLVFGLVYLLVGYVFTYYFTIIRLVVKPPINWSYFLFEEILIGVEAKYEFVFSQSLKAIKELGIRINTLDFDNGRIEGVFMPSFFTLLSKPTCISKKFLIEFDRSPLRENTYSIRINIIHDLKTRSNPFRQIAFIRSKSFIINRFVEHFMSKPK